MSAHPSLRSLTALVAGVLALATAALHAQGAPEEPERRFLAREPELARAVASAYREFEAAVFLRAPSAAAELWLEKRSDAPGVDPLRSALALESFAARVTERGGRARVAEGSAESAPSCAVRLALAVEQQQGALALTLRGLGANDPLGGSELCVPFVEKRWVRGALEQGEHFVHLLRVEGRALDPESARRAAGEAALAALREREEAAASLEDERLLSKISSWELDRFETIDSSSGLACCALLLGLRAPAVDALRAERLRARRAELGGFALRGGAGCLWFALCVMLYARPDLATRGYLSWPLRAGCAFLPRGGVRRDPPATLSPASDLEPRLEPNVPSAKNLPLPEPERELGDAPSPVESVDWESFYRNYRKPDYVHGYEIVNKLGSGAFGVVFKARKRSIGKLFAIKFLKLDDLATREVVLKELEGVRYFAQIDHPNLVSVEDRGIVDGIPFIVMGYAGEETLKTLLSRGPLEATEALRIFVQVCRGVHALHERSLIHFDLKPANIFLRGGLARVGDYGLSRLLTESRNTLSFGRGTPYYMAPELARLKGDHRSDIYSLGVLLFECLTHRVPFTGTNEFEVLRKHEEEPLAVPPELEARFGAILRRAMAKRPEDRYASILDLLADLGERKEPLAPPSSVGAAGPDPAIAPEPLARNAPRPVDRPSAVPPASGREAAPSTAELFDVVGKTLERLRLDRPLDAPDDGGPKRGALAPFLDGLETLTTWVAAPLRFTAELLGRALELAVVLPFRIFEWTLRLSVFALGVGLFFLFGLALRELLVHLL
ncbi:MAG: serine/threonine protein kinase [Planctomycetes bacterium]|nr:serine/threonine protein kinase [Planctomycetota bacterium]